MRLCLRLPVSGRAAAGQIEIAGSKLNEETGMPGARGMLGLGLAAAGAIALAASPAASVEASEVTLRVKGGGLFARCTEPPR